MTTAATDFEALFAGSDDPWGFRTRWYEARKRALTLACLPERHVGTVFEAGCANGELAAALAPRCDRLLACDASPAAVALARTRVAPFAHAQVHEARLPEQWPVDLHADLVVLSELLYYLAPAAIDRTVALARASLRPGGSLLACHWRRPIEGCALDGDAVHRRIADVLGDTMAPLCCIVEPDLRLELWSLDPRSVAQRGGLA